MTSWRSDPYVVLTEPASERAALEIRRLADAAPQQVGPYSTGRAPVAIFVQGADPSNLHSTEVTFRLLGVDGEDFQVVLMPPGEPVSREPFTLPIRITGIGAEAAPVLHDLRGRYWTQSENVRRFGLQIDTRTRLPRSERKAPPDVLVVSSPGLVGELTAFAPERRPRLLIVLGFLPDVAEALRASDACLVVPEVTPDTTPFVIDFFYAIFHDQPLHEALKTALRMREHRRDAASNEERPYLIADPMSIQTLRLWDALQEVARQSAELEQRLPPPRAKTVFKGLRKLPSAAASPFEDVRNSLRCGFGRESDSLVPMAEVLAALEPAKAAAAAFERRLSEVDAVEVEETLRDEERRVDVSLLRTDARAERPIFVADTDSLGAGRAYRVVVRIGRRSAFSIVQGDVPPIDPLLPPPPDERGHLLHVVLYPIDFGPPHPQIKPLRLPPFGSSEPVEFEVTAPERSGPAKLRLAVYYDRNLAERTSGGYRNHLIQSFLLETRVDAGEQGWCGAGTTAVTLEFSRTSFRNVDAFGERVASLAVNKSGDGTHLLMLKREGGAADVGLAQQYIQDQNLATRELLWNVSADQGSPRFPTGEQGDPVTFAGVIRRLADKGYELSDRLFRSDAGDGSVQQLVVDVSAAVDRIVQIVRLEQDFYFPWALLYDFPTPRAVHGAPPAPVCEGFLRRKPDGSAYSCSDCLAACLHPDKEEAYCVYGFWGTRLQVEQTLHRLRASDDKVPPLQPIGDGSVLVATALDTPTAKAFPGALKEAVGDAFVKEHTEQEALVDALWRNDRAAILVVLGHYKTALEQGEREQPRIQVPGGWLIADDIVRSVRANKVWQNPHSLVIIAACESAGEDLRTMNGFVSAFAAARAGAFLGTETSVFESLARRFALEITQAMLAGSTLGEAVLGFRRRLLLERNPLGLVFSAFGDADLQRAPKGETA